MFANKRLMTPPLWRPYLGGLPLPFLNHSPFEPLSDKFEYTPVADPSFKQAHQQVMVNGVKVTLNVGIHHPPPADESFLHGLDRLLCTSPRSKAIRAVLKV